MRLVASIVKSQPGIQHVLALPQQYPEGYDLSSFHNEAARHCAENRHDVRGWRRRCDLGVAL